MSRLDHETGFPIQYLFHHDQGRVQQILYRMEQRALAPVADRVLAERSPDGRR